ncbi:MAG: bile acid:sodium symporter family protein [Pirellulaceae bacterium]|nr:bile acid:sodium symporter family protein [Planctomycetales bacterium]
MPIIKVLAVVLVVCLAVGLRFVPALRTYQFTAWIMVSVVASMLYPEWFLAWSLWGGRIEFDLRNKKLALLVIQFVMFGMGTQMRLQDFLIGEKMAYGVAVGLLLQFTVMPLVGFTIAQLCGFDPEIGAGIVLVGCCSSGLASNVMTYIARGNLPLSITLTALATLMAPAVTPAWMKVLAGAEVEVTYFEMMMQIVMIVIVPIGAAMLHDLLRQVTPRVRTFIVSLAAIAIAWWLASTMGWIAPAATVTDGAHADAMASQALAAKGFGIGMSPVLFDLVAALTFAVTLGVVYHGITRMWADVEKVMPVVSMVGIIFFVTITTAAGRDDLLKIGLVLTLAAAAHNTIGYVLGYWLSRLCGLDASSARTVALEVGLQNGGMASGLASQMGKLATVGLAPAVFSPWMNVSGSLLANHWRRRPVVDSR